MTLKKKSEENSLRGNSEKQHEDLSRIYKRKPNRFQSERIMEENSMVRDLITKILDESGPTEGGSSLKPPEKAPITGPNQYQKPDGFNQQYNYHMYNYPTQNDQPGLNYNLQNGFTNGFNYDAPLMGVDTVDSTDVSPEQLNLLRLAAQEIGGAQFTNPKFENYNFFDQPRNTNAEMFPNFPNNRPNSLNMEMGINTNFENLYNTQRFPQNTRENQENGELLTYLNQLQVSDVPNSNPNLEFKMADMKYPGDDFKMQDPKAFYNRNFPPKTFNGDPNYFMNDMAQMVERPPPNYEFHQGPMNFKPNGFHQNEFMQRRDMPANHQRETYPSNGTMPDQRTFENGQNIQQAALMRQNQELARQMNMLMRSRPPPNQLNVDVSFLHDNPNFNLGVGALLGASPPMPPSVLPSPMLDLPLLAPFYTMRNMRGAATSSGILHARLDACYEQWRQLERERKRTEARLALAYPGRAVSSSNSIPVPRLPPCPTRVDRLTIDMLREHTKVLTLMGKMETLRASVCVAQNKKPNKEDPKITVLKRGQENIADKEKHGLDPNTFDPSTWREDIGHLAEIAPHSEVETAMLAWRNAVGLVQLARRRELQNTPRYPPADPILQLAEAVKQLCVCARRARCAMWSDLTLTVALAPLAKAGTEKTQTESTQLSNSTQASSKPAQDNTAKQDAKDSKEKDKPSSDPKPDTKQQSPENNNNLKTTNKNEKTDKRRPQNYRKVNGRNDFYQKNQRYDNRFMQNRHPYYLATGPIN